LSRIGTCGACTYENYLRHDLTIDAEGRAGNGVQLFDARTRVLRVLDSRPKSYTRPVWREDAYDLAVMRSSEDDAYEGPTHVVLAWRDLSGRNPRAYTFDPSEREAFPADTRITEHRALTWSDDGAAIFLGVQQWQKKEREPAVAGRDDDAEIEGRTKTDDSAGTEPDEERADPESSEEQDDLPGVEVWHSRDVDIIP
jgi:hypothetical protein